MSQETQNQDIAMQETSSQDVDMLENTIEAKEMNENTDHSSEVEENADPCADAHVAETSSCVAENVGSEDGNACDAASHIDRIIADHAVICQQLGLSKPMQSRGQYEQEKRKIGARPFIVLFLTAAVVAVSIGAWFGFEYLVQKQEEERYIADMERKQAEEEARRNRIEYADIAFLDSFPPQVAITMDGKQLYARSQDGSYTELRARESTWIRNLPIKGETVLKFGFSAEGFKPLTRSVAYYDWFPSRKPGANPLEKAFKKVVLEPDMTPRLPNCEQLPMIQDTSACDWSVFREIVFRERYAQTVKPLVLDEAGQRKALKSQFTLHPLLAEAAIGFDMARLDTNAPVVDPELPDATKALLKNVMHHPYGLYGAITVETDMPDTRVFFMSEPLMVVKASGSMSQVRVDPGKPYTFAVYGQGKPLEITEKYSIRLEAPNAPAYVTEISPHQWHCTVPGLDQLLAIAAPNIAPEVNTPDYRHFVCDYSLKISVQFAAIQAFEAEAAKQRDAVQNTAPAVP